MYNKSYAKNIQHADKETASNQGLPTCRYWAWLICSVFSSPQIFKLILVLKMVGYIDTDEKKYEKKKMK